MKNIYKIIGKITKKLWMKYEKKEIKIIKTKN